MQKYTTIFIVLLFFLPGGTEAQIALSIDTSAYYQQKIEKYLDKDKALGGFYSIDTKGISVFASSEQKTMNLAEYKIYWNEVDAFQHLMNSLPLQRAVEILLQKKETFFAANKEIATAVLPDKSKLKVIGNSARPLEGIKVAIDPGHIAGDLEMGKIEKKYIDMPADSSRGQAAVRLVEGGLTLETSLLLKSKLEEAGAQVMMTRSKPNQTAFGITFQEWMKCCLVRAVDSMFLAKEIDAKEKTFLLKKASNKDVFRTFFRDLDLAKRAERINAFHPDVTVVVHYNVDEANTGWINTTAKNFNMAFAGGSFLKGELEDPGDRAEFLRLLLSGDIERSVGLCSVMVQSFENELGVACASVNDASYLSLSCMPSPVKGVYLRNLTLTRLVHGTLVYGETLYQDNVKECLLLGEKNDGHVSKVIPSRVEQVADAYYKGLLKYFQAGN